jgi:Helix-turn-helix domain
MLLFSARDQIRRQQADQEEHGDPDPACVAYRRRWGRFRQGGGMPSTSLAPLPGRYLSFTEREEITVLRAQGCGVREIAADQLIAAVSFALRRGQLDRGRGDGGRQPARRPAGGGLARRLNDQVLRWLVIAFGVAVGVRLPVAT